MGMNATTWSVLDVYLWKHIGHHSGEQNCLQVTKISFKYCILTPRRRAYAVVDLKVPII